MAVHGGSSPPLLLHLTGEIKLKGETIMARVAMVTRTIYTTELEVLCMNIEKVEVENITVTLLGNITDNDTMLKKVKDKIETETLKPVHITSAKEIETLYGLTEEEFVNLAKQLPPRKSNAENTTITEEETAE
jgi:hypothetical protein